MSDPSSSDISKIATLAYYWDLFGSNVSPGRISKQLAVFYYTQCNGPGLPLVRSNQNFPTIVIQSYHLKAFHAPSRSWCMHTDQPVLHFCNLTGKLLVHVLYTKNISRGKCHQRLFIEFLVNAGLMWCGLSDMCQFAVSLRIFPWVFGMHNAQRLSIFLGNIWCCDVSCTPFSIWVEEIRRLVWVQCIIGPPIHLSRQLM